MYNSKRMIHLFRLPSNTHKVGYTPDGTRHNMIRLKKSENKIYYYSRPVIHHKHRTVFYSMINLKT